MVLVPAKDRVEFPPSSSRICTWWCAVCCAVSPVRRAGLRCAPGSRTPALPAARQETADIPAGPGLYTPARRLPAPPGRPLFHEVELPVGLLDAHGFAERA